MTLRNLTTGEVVVDTPEEREYWAKIEEAATIEMTRVLAEAAVVAKLEPGEQGRPCNYKCPHLHPVTPDNGWAPCRACGCLGPVAGDPPWM